jgi:hypothetical protein
MTDEIRRHSDGSIDFDFYRAEAGARRREAQRAALRHGAVGASVMAGALGFAVVIPASSGQLPSDQLAAILSSHLR